MFIGLGLRMPASGGPGLSPLLSLDFLAGTLPAGVTFTRSSGGSRINAAGLVAWNAGSNTPRFDFDPATLAPLGLLIEEQVTNAIPNSSGSGASAGSPGTLPTGWGVSGAGASGLTRTISVGTEGDLPYIDVRLQGTSPGGTLTFDFGPGSGVQVITPNVPVTGSLYFKLLAGSVPGTNLNAYSNSFNGASYLGTLGGTVGAFQAHISASSGAARLSMCRHAFTVAESNAAVTNFGCVYLTMSVTAGPVDFTVRLAGPQLERRAGATSWIPTSGSAATRAGETCSMASISWLNGAEGTFVSDFTLKTTLQDLRVFVLRTGTTSNHGHRRNAGGDLSVLASDGGYKALDGLNTGLIGNIKIASNYFSGAPLRASVNGGAVAFPAGANFTLPAVDNLQLGSDGNGFVFLNGYLKRLSYYNSALPDATLRSLSA